MKVKTANANWSVQPVYCLVGEHTVLYEVQTHDAVNTTGRETEMRGQC